MGVCKGSCMFSDKPAWLCLFPKRIRADLRGYALAFFSRRQTHVIHNLAHHPVIALSLAAELDCRITGRQTCEQTVQTPPRAAVRGTCAMDSILHLVSYIGSAVQCYQGVPESRVAVSQRLLHRGNCVDPLAELLQDIQQPLHRRRHLALVRHLFPLCALIQGHNEPHKLLHCLRPQKPAAMASCWDLLLKATVSGY